MAGAQREKVLKKDRAMNHAVPDFLKNLDVRGKSVMGYEKTGSYAGLLVENSQLLQLASILYENGYFIEDIAGVDTLEGIMVVYHFDHYDRSDRLTVRVLTSHAEPVVPSITSVYSGADWHERECFDFFGVQFEKHPNLKPLLLPDDLGYHPLIKEDGNRRSMYALLPFDQLVENYDDNK